MLKIAYFWQENLEHMMVNGQSDWFDDTRTEAVTDSLDDLLYQAARNAVATLEQELGNDPERWQWGDIH